MVPICRLCKGPNPNRLGVCKRCSRTPLHVRDLVNHLRDHIASLNLERDTLRTDRDRWKVTAENRKRKRNEALKKLEEARAIAVRLACDLEARGKPCDGHPNTAEYWVRHHRDLVRKGWESDRPWPKEEGN